MHASPSMRGAWVESGSARTHKTASAPCGRRDRYVARFARKIQDVPKEIPALRSTHANNVEPPPVHRMQALVRGHAAAGPLRLADGTVFGKSPTPRALVRAASAPGGRIRFVGG